MDIIELLIKLATNAHHSYDLENVFAEQNSALKKAFRNNDVKKIQKLISPVKCFAHEEHVAGI